MNIEINKMQNLKSKLQKEDEAKAKKEKEAKKRFLEIREHNIALVLEIFVMMKYAEKRIEELSKNDQELKKTNLPYNDEINMWDEISSQNYDKTKAIRDLKNSSLRSIQEIQEMYNIDILEDAEAPAKEIEQKLNA